MSVWWMQWFITIPPPDILGSSCQPVRLAMKYSKDTEASIIFRSPSSFDSMICLTLLQMEK